MKSVFRILAVLAGLASLGWAGLRIKPKPFPSMAKPAPALETVPLPEDLPAPVARYLKLTYGDEIPVITSAVLTGRATMRPVPFLPAIPARFRFIHQVGQGYRHYFEMTFFGQTFGVGNEHYLDGKSRLLLPFGLSDEGPQIDQAANLSMWAEYVWLPAALVTTQGVRWEPVDDHTALLVVPFGDGEQQYVLRFDPATGRLHLLESMRYKDSKSAAKTLWLNESLDWRTVSSYQLPATGAVTWFDQGKPWAIFTVEDVAYNVDVQYLIRQATR